MTSTKCSAVRDAITKERCSTMLIISKYLVISLYIRNYNSKISRKEAILYLYCIVTVLIAICYFRVILIYILKP